MKWTLIMLALGVREVRPQWRIARCYVNHIIERKEISNEIQTRYTSAGDIMRKYFGKKPDSHFKANNTIVTVADEGLVQAMKELEENVNKQG